MSHGHFLYINNAPRSQQCLLTVDTAKHVIDLAWYTSMRFSFRINAGNLFTGADDHDWAVTVLPVR